MPYRSDWHTLAYLLKAQNPLVIGTNIQQSCVGPCILESRASIPGASAPSILR